MPELKPCPFCGSEAILIVTDNRGLMGVCVRCPNCHAASDSAGLYELNPIEIAIETASEYWNSRA